MKGSLCARQWAKQFTCVNSIMPHNNSYIHFTDEEAKMLREVKELPKVTLLGSGYWEWFPGFWFKLSE